MPGPAYDIIQEMNDALKAKLKTLPSAPGVYFHKNKNRKMVRRSKAGRCKYRFVDERVAILGGIYTGANSFWDATDAAIGRDGGNQLVFCF